MGGRSAQPDDARARHDAKELRKVLHPGEGRWLKVLRMDAHVPAAVFLKGIDWSRGFVTALNVVVRVSCAHLRIHIFRAMPVICEHRLGGIGCHGRNVVCAALRRIGLSKELVEHVVVKLRVHLPDELLHRVLLAKWLGRHER